MCRLEQSAAMEVLPTTRVVLHLATRVVLLKATRAATLRNTTREP